MATKPDLIKFFSEITKEKSLNLVPILTKVGFSSSMPSKHCFKASRLLTDGQFDEAAHHTYAQTNVISSC